MDDDCSASAMKRRTAYLMRATLWTSSQRSSGRPTATSALENIKSMRLAFLPTDVSFEKVSHCLYLAGITLDGGFRNLGKG
jgi:hypothetical protein